MRAELVRILLDHTAVADFNHLLLVERSQKLIGRFLRKTGICVYEFFNLNHFISPPHTNDNQALTYPVPGYLSAFRAAKIMMLDNAVGVCPHVTLAHKRDLYNYDYVTIISGKKDSFLYGRPVALE